MEWGRRTHIAIKRMQLQNYVKGSFHFFYIFEVNIFATFACFVVCSSALVEFFMFGFLFHQQHLSSKTIYLKQRPLEDNIYSRQQNKQEQLELKLQQSSQPPHML